MNQYIDSVIQYIVIGDTSGFPSLSLIAFRIVASEGDFQKEDLSENDSHH
jgi:hypothetical protein